MRESNNANRQDGTRIFRSEFSFSRPHEASEKGKMQFTNFRNDQEEIMIREERRSVTYLICSFAFFFFFSLFLLFCVFGDCLCFVFCSDLKSVLPFYLFFDGAGGGSALETPRKKNK